MECRKRHSDGRLLLSLTDNLSQTERAGSAADGYPLLRRYMPDSFDRTIILQSPHLEAGFVMRRWILHRRLTPVPARKRRGTAKVGGSSMLVRANLRENNSSEIITARNILKGRQVPFPRVWAMARPRPTRKPPKPVPRRRSAASRQRQANSPPRQDDVADCSDEILSRSPLF